MENEKDPKPKTQPARRAGTALPRQRHRRPGKAPQLQTGNAAVNGVPALTTETLTPEVRDGTAPGAVQELFGPQEWDALLAGLDHEHAARAPSAVQPAADDLWERLSKARWLPKAHSVVKPQSRARARPSA